MATFSYQLPTVSGSENTWGSTLNNNWTALGTFLGALDSAELAVLDGITSTTAELNLLTGLTDSLNGLTATAAELNLLDGSAAATVVNSKAVVYGTSGEVAANTVDLGNWTITESLGVLYFATGGVNKMKLDASGNLTVVGDITAFGTV